MIISYKKRSTSFNLVYGLFHMVLAFIMMYVEEHLLMTYFWMAFSVLCIINYYFQKKPTNTYASKMVSLK